MAEPGLSWTPSVLTYGGDDATITAINNRGGYLVESQDDKFSAWADWANSSGTDDQKTLAGRYSGYAFTTYVDVGGIATFGDAVDQIFQGIADASSAPFLYTNTWPSTPAKWFPNKSGFCIRDAVYGLGGYCYMYRCDNAGSPCAEDERSFANAFEGDVYPYRLTDADFDSIFGAVYTNGYALWSAIDTAASGAISSGTDYLDKPVCTAPADRTTGTVHYCQQYQPAVQQDKDGEPRFNSSRVVTFYGITGFFDTAAILRNSDGTAYQPAGSDIASATALAEWTPLEIIRPVFNCK